MTTFASSCCVASPSALEVLGRFDIGTEVGGLKLLLREGGSILDILDLTGLGLLVVVAVEAFEGLRSRGIRAELVELVGEDLPSLFATRDTPSPIVDAPSASGGEGKGKEAAPTVLCDGCIVVGVKACSRGENERERVRVRIEGLLLRPSLLPLPPDPPEDPPS